MADVVISGFVGVGIQMAINQILRHINIAIEYREELESLKDLLLNLQDINSALQKYRSALSSGQVNSSHEQLIPSAVNKWLNKLDFLLQQASEMVQQCTVTISSWDVFPRYKMSKRISRTISRIKEHRENAASIGITIQLLQSVNRLQLFNREDASSSSFSLEERKYIGEPLIVGQDSAFARLEELLKNASRIGVVGMGGAGKTLLLKRLFNTHQVHYLLTDSLRLWLTVSQTPSFKDLRNDLGNQIAFKTNENFNSNLSENDIKIWLETKMRENKFALFLDDVWDRSAYLLEELGVPQLPTRNTNCGSSVIIASSRNSSALLEMGIATAATIQMQDLGEDESWQLFLSHAFPHNDGKIPTSIKEETARGICSVCGGLPLAVKVTGRAMAGITTSEGWEITLNKLQNAESIKDGGLAESLYGRLRLSYDALAGHDISLQMCFLYLAAFREDQVITTVYVSIIWYGEGLLGRHDPYQHGQAYVDLLASRCLIEPVQKDIDGRVVRFRVHDVLYTLATQIAETEENCFFRSGKGLREFPANDCSRYLRISLRSNELRRVPSSFRCPHIRSLLLDVNPDLKEIPKQVIGSMTSLTVLDLSGTSLVSLPETIGCLKHLVSLRLSFSPLTRLPNSITLLKNLEILDLYKCDIRELPSDIHKLSSLIILDISLCKNLQSLPYGMSQLKSLESLRLDDSPNTWVKIGRKKDPLLISDLSALKQLKWLQLSNNGQIIEEGTLGSMTQMEFLYLNLTDMESLPRDITAMSKLRKLCFDCPELIKMEHNFCAFEHLSHIKLYGCRMLKQLPDLHKLVRLKQLDIVLCSNIEKFPKEFGDRGSFPALEILSLVWLEKLEELPEVEEEAMPSLKTLSLVECKALQVLPESYWNLKSLVKIRVYGCSTVLLNRMQEKEILTNRKVQTLTMSGADLSDLRHRVKNIVENKEYGELWSNELFQFLFNALYLVID